MMERALGKVSIIIPTYNRPAALAEALESLFRQTYKHLEVIVVNDAGEDVGPICGLYPELDIRVINQPENRKHVYARIRGIAEAAGEYLLMLDDDDMLLPDHVERMVKELGDADFVYADAEIFDYRTEGRTRIPVSRHLFAFHFSPELARRFNPCICTGCLYRASLHERLGALDPDVYHYWDWDWVLRVSQAGRVKRVPSASVLYAFAAEGNNVSGSHEQMKGHLERLCAKHGLGDLPTNNFFVMLQDPDIQASKAESAILWDGAPIISRYAAGSSGSGS